MILLGILDSCPNCSLWLIPLLIGAWLLGYLLWNWTKGARYKNEIGGLQGDIKNWKKKFNDTEGELSEARFEKERVNGEYATLKSRFSDYDTKYRSMEKNYNSLLATGGGGDVDMSQWNNKISDLESQLEVSRNTNLKLQGDYAKLKNKFSEVQNQVNQEDSDIVGGSMEDQKRIAELEQELQNAQARYTQLNIDHTNMKGEFDGLALKAQSENSSGQPSDYEARINDLEKKLAISYENNTKMESDYAHLKAEYGDLEIKSQDVVVGDNSEEILGYQNRISELELLLASSSGEDDLEPGEGKKKKKRKKKKSKKNKSKKRKNKSKKKKKKGGKKKKDEKGKQGSGGNRMNYGLVLQNDNLQIIEGIGPKIESLLKGAGINSWIELANTDNEKLKEIMVSAGSRYKMHDPTSWPQQAELAYKGDWEKLVNDQKVMNSSAGKMSDSKAEKMYTKAIGFKIPKADDLKVIEGVGPKIEELLKNAGIDTWKKVSETDVAEIQKVLDAAGPRYKLANPGTWPKQAKLAADSDWANLKTYQDQLNGGKA